MKNYVSKLALLFFGLSLIYSCGPLDKPKTEGFPYELEINSTELINAPALQSFAHGVYGDNWLLFAGRTNSKGTADGGLHKIVGPNNYASTSFLPPSFNERIYVYNVSTDAVAKSITIVELQKIVKDSFPTYSKILEQNLSVFRNTNSQVKQLGNFLYLVGGYGPADLSKPSGTYNTYDHVAKIHIPSLVSLVKGDFASVDKDNLFAFGKASQLSATGGELQAIGSALSPTLYLVGGHCFGGNCSNNGQKYLDAAYPFTLKPYVPTKDKDSLHFLTVSVSNPISDVSDPTANEADEISTMRRRDGPILPTLSKSPVTTAGIEQGFAFFAGVFKPGSDLQAWNDAVYFHPGFANSEGKLFTEDTAYNQNNYNVYSCPNFVVYDSNSEVIHSFLMGGIGDGKFDPAGNLSGFTNTGMHIKTTLADMKSSNELISPKNLFNKNKDNVAPFYGAEAIFFTSNDVAPYSLNGVETELLDMSKFGDADIFVGYIYGGIEAFVANPARYGPRKSRASNKIFKITLKKK
tara:strand:+ start:170 stop:1732 length:1563 start_codon:yes stop_codon:yes gene_type:complete